MADFRDDPGFQYRLREGQKLLDKAKKVIPPTEPLQARHKEPKPIPETAQTGTNRPAINPPSKEVPTVRRVSNAPRPPTVLSGTGGWMPPSPKPAQMPLDWPPYYPNDLKPQTTVTIGKALKKFPVQTQTLDFCRYVISELTPHFRTAVLSNTLRADLAQSAMRDLLQLLLVSNCDASTERFRLEQELHKSDEWIRLAEELLAVKEVAGAKKVEADNRLAPDRQEEGSQSAWAKVNQAEIDAKLEVLSTQLRQERNGFIRDRLAKVRARPVPVGSLPIPLPQPTDVFRATLDAEVAYLDRFLGGICATVEESLTGLATAPKPEDLRDAWMDGVKPRWNHAVTMGKRHVEMGCRDMGPDFVKAQCEELEGESRRIHDRHLADWRVKMEQARTTWRKGAIGRRKKSRQKRKFEGRQPIKAKMWSHTRDYTSVSTPRGEKFTLTPDQARVIKILDEARANGNPNVSKRSILAELERETSRLQDIFRSTPGAWKALIHSTRRGVYRLNLPGLPVSQV